MVESNTPTFQLYISGVITGSCGFLTDLAVLAVGWGVSATAGNYWIV